jgi:hypothetical protein
MESHIDFMQAKLIQAGWQVFSQNPFREKVSQGAEIYFTYKSINGQNLGISFFEATKVLKIRLSDAQNQDCRWFASECTHRLEELLQAIINQQDTVNFAAYFGFYLALSGICPTSIVAWEQWER